MKYLAASLLVLLSSCSGTHSTIREGFAFRVSEEGASALVDSIIRSNVASDMLLPGSKLVACGYDRFMLDTQTYTATAIPVPRQSAYGFELSYRGTRGNGPGRAKRMYADLLRRAELMGQRITIQ